MIVFEQETRKETIYAVGKLMMAAARTAPKARGTDNLHVAMLTGDDLIRLADRMEKDGTEKDLKFFVRDAANVRSCDAVVLFGTPVSPLGLDCGYCGYATCALKHGQSPLTPCVFNSNDLGLAIGSAVSVASAHHIDSRVMFSAGASAHAMGYLKECAYVLAVPLSCSGKSPFFDRPAL